MSTLKERFAELQAEFPDITQADIARATGAKRPSVNDWFSGETKSMKIQTAMKAAALYGVSPLWLSRGEGDKHPRLDEINELTSQLAVILRMIPSQQRDAACWKALQALTNFVPQNQPLTIVRPALPGPQKTQPD